MKRTISLAVAVLLPIMASAQQPVLKSDRLFLKVAIQDAAAQSEQIEIMRLLVEQTVAREYGYVRTAHAAFRNLTPTANVTTMTQAALNALAEQQWATSELRSDLAATPSNLLGATPSDPANAIGLTHSVMPSAAIRAMRAVSSLATRISDYGLVIQLGAPPLRAQDDGPSGASPQASCPFMARPEWERMQMQLRGDANATECAKCHHASKESSANVTGAVSRLRKSLYTDRFKSPTKDQLIRAVIGVLAENGKQLSMLGAGERITVAITLGSVAATTGRQWPTTPPHGVGMVDFDLDGNLDLYIADNMVHNLGDGRFKFDETNLPTTWRADAPVSWNAETTPAPNGPAAGAGSPPPTNAVAGDLYFRQGDFEKAADAYEKALREAGVADPYGQPRGADPQHYKRLIQAQVGAGNFTKAKQLLEKMSQAPKSPKDSEKKANAAAEKKFSPPDRLLITVTKELLDQAGANKLTREELTKRAVIEHVTSTLARTEVDGG